MIQTARKLERFADALHEMIFVKCGEAKAEGYFETLTPLSSIPSPASFGPVPETWGGEGKYGWFSLSFDVPPELDGKVLFLYPHTGFYEATLWVNGRIHSNYAAKYVESSHGNHWCNRFTAKARAGERYDFALECYAFHEVPGTAPFENTAQEDYTYPVRAADVCIRDDELMAFCFDLKTVLSLRDALDMDSFRRAEAENALYEAHLHLYYDRACCTEEEFRAGIRAAWPYLREVLKKHNGEDGPWFGLTGHSHMDTAWLWPMTETEKKCARTYANQLNLMEEYPEYRFIQSSAFHTDWLRRDYPELFERIQKAVASGRYEPNGGVWVECDCNVTGGESMIRQFLWGQRFTRKYFGYTSDCFWLPDTFGYSFAIPQIMKGCGIKYFLTTKMSWNDTNVFPMTTFLWQGMDGTQVLTHLNRTHAGPTPKTFMDETSGSNPIREKRVAPMRLFSFGRGDGGGGPEFEMLEMARRLQDLQGIPKSQYMSVSDFMNTLERTAVRPTVYAGEMYLELHRGTLTNQHTIKHNNRFCEIALHDLEAALVQNAVRDGVPACGDAVAPLMNQLLVHQFHDLLPGTCIHSAHEEAIRTMGETIWKARELLEGALTEDGGQPTVFNPLSFDRTDTVEIEGAYHGLDGAVSQVFEDRDGVIRTAVHGLTLPAYGRLALKCTSEAPADASPFRLDGNELETPFASICFDDETGAIASLIDRRSGRELVGGLPFNTFMMCEEIPADWDNWDLDADAGDKFRPAEKLLSRQVVSDGPVQLRIRSTYAIGEHSKITQDMIFDAFSPLISFDTLMDWQEDHRFLKVAFDTTLHADGVRNEIQFGYIRRSNHRSNAQEKARFEVCNHKYSDLSEDNGGLAVFNDSKYGISALEGSLRLSLHKGGCRPDKYGDKGLHETRYAIYPHADGFHTGDVVRGAYAFNVLPVFNPSGSAAPSLVKLDSSRVIIETVKPCEDTQKAYILRLYEAMGGYEQVHLTFSHPVQGLYECNMLEEEQQELDPKASIEFTPFRIRTIKVCY
ncbi:MAG: alpha-mannosidase [Clostridia bacterium]|nr:alpha-mannosidase [Clostridia bacterium]